MAPSVDLNWLCSTTRRKRTRNYVETITDFAKTPRKKFYVVPVQSSTYCTYGTAKYWEYDSTLVEVTLPLSTWVVEVLLLCLYHCLRTVLMVLSSTGTSSHHDSTLEASVQQCASTVLMLLSLCHCTWLYFPSFNLTSFSSSPFIIRSLVTTSVVLHLLLLTK